ncbi:hypothetical protein J7T55_015664 [Diaporthe amygdali]|uniref:uncharacterized protein n=1 Tax=Phomopsis amygdali TaxID=1214568 RepID=UPI0022FEC82B|nr:uncharacterized protein J7T55_015664 [Diaporthe amygdali]KAJ0120926.1 hypothetical protein J7T55_015664 [Diaporthe amygdali]
MSFRPADRGSSPEQTEHPRKRQKTLASTVSGDEDAHVNTVRQSKACANCRKVKVKCVTAEEGRASNRCARCLRLDIVCLRQKKSWTTGDTVDDEASQLVKLAERYECGSTLQTQMTIVKLSRAVEDILDKLGMPHIDLYSQPAVVDAHQPLQETRQHSEEPAAEKETRERNVSPDPMKSLIEATRLNGLRSQLRSGKLRKKGGMRRMDCDLVSEKIISFEEAEEMLALFRRMQSRHLFSASISSQATLESIRSSSTVLFTSLMLVTSLHIPGKELVHEMCHSRFMGLVSSVMFDRFLTLDDIRGLCIAALWQPDLSWKLSGLSIRMATELNLHHAFYEAFNSDQNSHSMTAEARKECLEKARLWYLLYVLDHQSGIAHGRPPMKSALRPIKDYELLLSSADCINSDTALLAQVTGLAILSRAFDHFGLEPKRIMAGSDDNVLNHLRFTEEIRAWRDKWLVVSQPMDQNERASSSRFHNGSYSRDITLQFLFSNLVLNSLVLRGRPLDRLSELPVALRPLALRAVDTGHAILQHFLDEPSYHDAIVGMPLYMHSMIAFAVAFLTKLAHRWPAIGITVDPATCTEPLIKNIIKLLRSCTAGKNHMVYSMADGFERMLRQMKKAQARRQQGSGAMDSHESTLSGTSRTQSQREGAAPMPGDNRVHSNFDRSSNVSADSPDLFGGWGFQNDGLWSTGMGYDLLDYSNQYSPAGTGFSRFQGYEMQSRDSFRSL